MAEWSENILRELINQEIQAGNFYKFIAEKINNEKSKRLILKIASDEDSHRESIANKYKLITGNRFEPARDLPELPEFDYGDLSFLDNAKAMELTSFAISAEKSLVEQYRVLSDAAPTLEDQKLAKKLVKFEQGHIKKLQAQYRFLEKREKFWG